MKKQSEYNAKWVKKNKDHAKYLRYRSIARVFVREMASQDDLAMVMNLIVKRRKEKK